MNDNVDKNKIAVIIPAAGQGKRMGKGYNKNFIPLLGRPVLMYSIASFLICPEVVELIIVVAPDEVEATKQLVKNNDIGDLCQVVAGGSERQYSIANAIGAMRSNPQIIMVHDGARPLVNEEIVRRVAAAAAEFGAAVTAVPVKDTIKIVDGQEFVVSTPSRQNLWAVQTPQAFTASLLKRAYNEAAGQGFLGTDDASLVERLGVKVKLVMGSYSNLKITTPEDIMIAETLIGRSEDKLMRVGFGYDVHKLAEGRKLILGGVHIPFDKGLAGHSDADVLLHAIKDAMLGAAALGDIGRHFPDTDPNYKGISSLVLLQHVTSKLLQAGYKVYNIDATIVAEKPKLAPHIDEMNKSIAEIVGVSADRINVKATTTEGLGFAGRKEGIAAYAVVTLRVL